MKQIREAYKKKRQLHHAYGLEGVRQEIEEELFSFIVKDLKFPVIDNPDFWQGEYNTFKIKDSRTLNEAHLNMPVKYERKVFVIFANFMTKDAQNSLLKIFEEPRADSVFFLVLPSFSEILPTLKSRLIINNISNKAGKGEDAEVFLNAKVGKRLAIVTKMIKDIKDEKSNKSDAITFLKNIEKSIKENLKLKNEHNAKGGSLLAIEDIEKAISYANDESPSIKVILEHLAFVL